MPTAAKPDKQSTNELQDPQKLVHNLVEKKIRNLEKRKARLQELKDLEKKGQELEHDQQIAIKKLDQVIEMIDLMKDLNKSITEVFTENNKVQKKLAKKEQLEKQLERQQQELDRLKTIIQFQDILGRFDSTVRQDFIKGTNGAIKLTEEELTNLDKLYNITSDSSEKEITSTAEALYALSEGKPREAWTGVPFNQLKELLLKIVNSKYFNTETTTSSTTTTTTTTNTNKSNVVTSGKGDETKKQLTNESEPSNTVKSTPTQFQSLTTSDVMNLNQFQSQINSGISFMRDPIVENELQHKDPAVVAVASVPNFPYHHQYGIQSNEQLVSAQMTNSIPNASVNPQKMTSYENVSSMSTIPTQTYTNQNFAALIPGSGPFVPVPVTLATSGPLVHSLPIQGIVPPDMASNQISSDLVVGHNYPNHQNFMDSNQDKHQTTSQDRGSNFQNDDNNTFRNNRNRGRGGNTRSNQGNNVNGYANRPRNPNKGPGSFQMGSYDRYPKYDNNNMNGSNFGNNNMEKSSNNFSGNPRGRQQANRGTRTDPNRGPNNRNFNTNYTNSTAAK